MRFVDARYWKISIFLLLGLVPLGCMHQRAEQLSKRIDSYWQGMRWRAPGTVGNLVEEKSRNEQMQKITQQLDQMRVVEYNVMNLTFDDKKESAQALINYSYYRINQNDLLSAQEMQMWRYHPKAGWQVVPPATKTRSIKPAQPTQP